MAPPRKQKPKRNCLVCGNEFELKSSGLSHSSKKYCSHKCSSIGQRKYTDREWSLNCSVCGRITKYYSRENYRRAIRDNRTMCIPCRGKANKGLKRTVKQKTKIAEKTKEAMQKPEIWNKFMASMTSESHREKKRIQFSKQMIQKGNGVLYNKRACEFFELLNETLGWDGVHAENGGEMCVGGFWVDYYEPNLNIVIEWDEPHHRYNKKAQHDRYRAKYIIQKLKCKFLRIDQETLKLTEVMI